MRAGLALAWVVLAALVALVACRGGASARLQGHWQGVRAEGVEPDVQAASDAFASSFSMDFDGNVFSLSTAKETQSGPYTVVKEDTNTVIITTGTDASEDRETFTLVDDKTLKWAITDGKLVVLTRR